MKVSDLYREIEDGLDMSGDILAIDVIKDVNNVPKMLSIKASCPNYPEQKSGFYQISLSDLNLDFSYYPIITDDIDRDGLKSLASYEINMSEPVSK